MTDQEIDAYFTEQRGRRMIDPDDLFATARTLAIWTVGLLLLVGFLAGYCARWLL